MYLLHPWIVSSVHYTCSRLQWWGSQVTSTTGIHVPRIHSCGWLQVPTRDPSPLLSQVFRLQMRETRRRKKLSSGRGGQRTNKTTTDQHVGCSVHMVNGKSDTWKPVCNAPGKQTIISLQGTAMGTWPISPLSRSCSRSRYPCMSINHPTRKSASQEKPILSRRCLLCNGRKHTAQFTGIDGCLDLDVSGLLSCFFDFSTDRRHRLQSAGCTT